jgi:hypothetical protein
MLIVIFLGIVFFWVLGICLKRRHDRKRDARRGNLAAPDAFIVNHAHPHPHPSAAHPNGAPAKETSMMSPPSMGIPSARTSVRLDGVGGIAPPRSARARSGSGTLNSANHGSAGAGYPVVWGPHQNQAHGSPLNSVPPSPTVGSPSPVYLNGGAGAGYGYGAPSAVAQGKRGISVETAQVPSPMNPSPVSPIEEAGGMLSVPGQGQGYGQGLRAVGAPAGAQRIREMRSKESMRRGSLGRGGALAEGGGDGVGRKLSKKLERGNSRHS